MKSHPTYRFDMSFLVIVRVVFFLGLGLLGLERFSPSVAQAGGGPENLLLIVNANSHSSLTIANHYADLRKVPSSNVVYLDWKGGSESTSLETYRENILKPILKTIEKRKLRGQIDYLIYSSDFPTRIDIKSVLADQPPRRELSPTASLTGVTYLYELALADSPKIAAMGNNFYTPLPIANPARQTPTKSLSFHHWYGWGLNAKRMESGGRNYYLSTMLGVTSGRGNKLSEVVSYLQRSAAADSSHPRGTIYYMQNKDVRSKTRQGGFARAVKELKKLDVNAEILPGKLPQGKSDVQGVMVGSSTFQWPQSGSTILPGAICEHLTSYGGILSRGAGQTPLTEFLKFGAAGASGTVVEPLAIQAKFPLPSVHVHYAQGCSLAESFYQSVSGPFQLLIVGDPLCQPWADLPRLRVSGLKTNMLIDKPMEFSPIARNEKGRVVHRFEVYIDGLLHSRCRAGETFTLNGKKLLDGVREVRVVAIGAQPIASRGRLIVPVLVKNKQGKVTLRVTNGTTLKEDGEIRVSAHCAGAKKIVLYQNRRRVGEIRGARGKLTVPLTKTGSGPLALYAIGFAPHPIFSQTVRFVAP